MLVYNDGLVGIELISRAKTFLLSKTFVQLLNLWLKTAYIISYCCVVVLYSKTFLTHVQ